VEGPVGFASAVLLVPAFGAQLVEAVGDLVRGTNAAVPVFHRIGRWADEHLLLLGVYTVAALVVWLVVVL
jgi:hypothetical protein